MTLILGRKKGMTQLFAEDGTVAGVTVVEAGPCVITQIRTQETDGYNAIQLGFEDMPDRLVAKPQRGHFAKNEIAPKRFLREERIVGPAECAIGDVVNASAFVEGDLVDVIGTTKGRGFSGTIKRHGFSRGPETHGSHNTRAPGSIGCSATPSRVLKGKRSSGQYGNTRCTTKNLRIMRIDEERNLVFIRGGVPGPPNGLVQICTAKTGIKKG
ncbi:MAG: 50S ribosomal protein L3 [Planctomycetota bacterium]|jgi:large subunit ribosomal protein L3|nr:50S ribosomal protein L3 [Planctomycetota bacterium]